MSITGEARTGMISDKIEKETDETEKVGNNMSIKLIKEKQMIDAKNYFKRFSCFFFVLLISYSLRIKSCRPKGTAN